VMFALAIRSGEGDQIRSPARTFTGLRLAHAFPWAQCYV
jgi:hypothetical protein